MIPFFVVYRKQAIPYYAALLSHIFIGDFITGGVELFWPLSHNLFGVLNFDVASMPIAITELALFLLTVPVMYKLGDLKTLLSPRNRNWALIIPLGAVLGPLLAIGRGSESAIPTLLVVPSLFYLVLFSISLIVWLNGKSSKPYSTKTNLNAKAIKSSQSNYKRQQTNNIISDGWKSLEENMRYEFTKTVTNQTKKKKKINLF